MSLWTTIRMSIPTVTGSKQRKMTKVFTKIPECHIPGENSPKQIELDRQNAGRIYILLKSLGTAFSFIVYTVLDLGPFASLK